MSTVTKAISSVEFHVNARQANAALQSIQEEAKRCREQVEELQEQAAKGVTTVKVDGMDVDIQKRIREVKALQKTWESAAQSQIKGAKAFDELWKNARMGTIESMTGAQIKSGINASKPIYDRLRLGDAEDRMKAQAIKDMQDQGQKVLNQLKTTTDQIIKQIADGETIAADVLEREARNLKSIMDLLPPLSQEWKDYNLQYQAINQQIERQTVLERQLRGEIVTREDAIRVINAANREATQQEIAQEEQRAKAAREAAEAKSSEADQYRTTVEQKQSEIFATNDLIAAKRREIDAHHESAAAAKDAADKARDAAYKDRKQAEQEARNQQDAYNKQKKIRDDAAKDVEKFRKELEKLGPVEQKEAQNTEELTRLQEAYNQKVERRKQLEQELDAIKARSLEDDPHVKQLREEISTLDELIAVSDKYRKQFAKMSDTAFEKGYMGKTGLEDERTSVFRAEDYLKRAYRDKMKAGVADMNPDDPEYQDAAKRVAGGIVQNAQENLRRAIFNEIKGGELSSKALEEKIETYRNMMGQAAREAYSLKDDPEYNTYKYIIAQMEKYLDVARQVEAERQKIAGNEPFMKATQSDVLNDVFGDSLIRQRDKRMFDELTAGRPFREKQEQDEATAKRELKKAQDEESESLGRLNKAKKESTEQTAASNEQDEKRAGVQQKLTDAETRLADENRKLNEQADKTITANQQATQAVNTHQQSVKALGDVMEENRKTGQRLGEEMGELTKQHKQQTEELAEASEKMTDAEKESNRHIKTEQEARLRIQQLNNQSIEQLTASLRVLEEENRRINDPGNQRWQENERYIGQLNLRLEELKKQSAELRGEWMTVADAMKYADSIGTEGFVTTDAETKKATEALQRQRETLVGLIHEKERDGDATADERQELERLETALAKISTGFADADDVMKRFSEHMKGTVVTTLGQSIDEQLSQHTSNFDDTIKQYAEDVDDYEQQLKEATAELDKMEKELAELEAKHKNSSWFRKQTREYKREAWRIDDLREAIGGRQETMDDGSTFTTGQKGWVEYFQERKQYAKEQLDYWKQQKAEALGLVEVEEQVQKARRMTREEMQQGIKLLEEEAMAQDRSTADGQKRWEELRKTIGEMNQELKEATGEWMKLADAEKIAEGAGKKGFAASAQEIQQATQALERRREELIKQIRAERDLGNAVDAQEKELDDLTKKLRSLKFEQDNVNMSQEKMRTLIETPANAVNLDELRAAIKRADGQLRQMQDSLGQNSDEYKRFAEQVRQAKNVMKEMEGQAKASATAWEKAFSRLKTYVVMYMGFNEVWQKVSNTARDLMDLSDRMGEVRKTTGFTADEVGRLSENLKKMDVRTSLTSLMEISASAGQLGLKTLEDVQGFTEAANKLMIALPEMGREAATEMMRVAIATGEVDKIRKQLQEGTIEGSSATAVAMEKIASTIDRLRATSASTAPEITDFVKRVGAVGAQSGITIDQVAALGSTVSSLGMRIEMSATALSRMIPAIRNNAFELAKAIGVTPDTIRNLFDTGRGMEVILMILQRIKDTGMDADSVEQMLGMAGMRDIMKDLNQQGARAGIVFSGLSQNVDELRRQLGVASEAYEENIAIQQEFDKMNETTAAKWERLKNKFEEMFVGDEAQRGLGVLIDMLRGAVDIINDLQGYIVRIGIAFAAWKAGVGGAIWTYLINPIKLALTGVHSLDFQVKGLAATWRTAWKSMDAATKTNWIFAIISAVVMLGKHIYDTATRISELQQELNRLDNETDDAVRHVGRLVTSFNEVSVKANAANKKEAELREQTEKLSKEVDKLKKSTDDGTASTDELKKKQAELEEKEKQLKKATDESNKANKERSNLISEMNSKYSTYLGYMLNEKTAAEQVASAHQLIIAALKEERKQKGLNALHDAVDKEYAEDIKEYSEDSQSNLKDIPRGAQRRILDQWRRVLTAATIDADKGEFRLSGVNGVTKGGTYRSEEELKKAMRSALREIIKTEAADVSGNVNVSTWAGKGIKSVDTFLNDIWGNSIDDGFGDWAETYISRERDIAQATHDNQVEVNQAHQETVQAAVADINSNMEALRKTSAKNNKFTDDQIRSMAQNVNALVAGYERHSEDMTDSERNRIFGEGNEATLQNAVNNVLANLDQNTRARVFRVAQRGKKTGTGDVDTNITNPWGTSERADSTTYTEMTAEQLVNRRKQMNDFVNAIQTDTDVKAVLNEDKALKKAIEAGMSSDMRTVIEWYNTERLKIQDELHARHLTNTGDWLDPKKERGAKKQFRDEMDAYLHELDAYYTERKTRIEQARNDEEITEGEAWRRTIQNDNEWQTRRAELQKLYSRKQQEVTQEELNAIYHIISERTGDTESFVKAQIAKTNQFVNAIEKSGDKGAAIVHRWMSQVVLDTERSYLKAAQAIGKQMKFIEDTLAKERPYDGITKNLQDNLDKMGVLAAKYRRENEELARQGKEPKYSNEQITAQSFDEMAFYLRQAADAYSIDIDELLRRMVKEGMTATAEEISKSDMLKQALMGQLRKTYQEVQDAIKKEASQIKKDVEIIWNDDARGIGGMSMKATFDKALAQLGMQQDSVSRANSLIGAGAASDNVASRLAMKQIEVQMRMQKAQYDMYRVQANQRMAALKAEAKEHQRIAELEKQAGHEAAAAEQRTKAMVALRDAENVRLSLGLTLAEETKKQEQQKAELLKIQEESQNRLYTSLREWANLLTSSLQGVFEASHAGDAEYYNERAKLNLTGKGGPGAGTYVVIDDAGTSDATAHYEYLDERQALEREHEIEVQNAQAEAWRKLMDDLNMKMSEQITDWMNAYLQNKATEDNTAELQRLQQKLEAEQQKMDASVTATDANTQAVQGLTQQLAEGITIKQDGTQPGATGGSDFAADKQAGYPSAPSPTEAPSSTTTGGTTAAPADGVPVANGAGLAGLTAERTQEVVANIQTIHQADADAAISAAQQVNDATAELPNKIPDLTGLTEEQTSVVLENAGTLWDGYSGLAINAMQQVSDAMEEMPNKMPNISDMTEEQVNAQLELLYQQNQGVIDANDAMYQQLMAQKQKFTTTSLQNDKKEEQSTSGKFAKMATAANMYGIAYQTMSNDNLSTAQKFQVFALQAAGQAAISMLTMDLAAGQAKNTVQMPGILGKLLGEMPYPAAIATFAGITALMGGLMALAMSSVTKSKSEIAQATGASVGAGRLATGMLTYAEGNVNELTDPASLTPGRQYNVDGADGKTYRARYMGKGAKTHITNGPEFHLVGEAGREAIIDAKTTRLLQMNDTGIWRDIQTLYNGGSISGLSTRRRRGGVRAFADGNVGEFEDMADGGGLTAEGTGGMSAEVMTSMLETNSRLADLLENALVNGIKAVNKWTGSDGIPAMYNKMQKEAQRHGEKYL